MQGIVYYKRKLKESLSMKGKDENLYVFFNLKLYYHQKEILEDLNLEREEYGSYKTPVIAATGSGKTITSFKTALFLSTRGGFDKVIFLVDRRELDKKTSENFKAYASYEPVTVDDTKHTYHLRKQLLSVKKGIIVTTTYKLSNLVKDLVDAQDYDLSKKRLIFIIDEAHRTTMGEMMVSIKTYFKKNSLFYGYTGTPLFDENQVTGMVNQA